MIFPRIKTFTDEFHAGKPAGYEPTDAQKPSNSKDAVKKASEEASPSAAQAKSKQKSADATKAESSSAVSAGQKIVVKETFYASAHIGCYVMPRMLGTVGAAAYDS